MGSAHASYYEINCSNGEGTIKIAEGHRENSITLTEKIWDNSVGRYSSKTHKLYEGIYVDFVSSCPVENPSPDACTKDGNMNMRYSAFSNLSKISITKEDKSEFSKDFVGVSKDQKSIEAYVICDGVLL